MRQELPFLWVGGGGRAEEAMRPVDPEHSQYLEEPEPGRHGEDGAAVEAGDEERGGRHIGHKVLEYYRSDWQG